MRWACWYPLFSTGSYNIGEMTKIYLKYTYVVCVCCIIFDFETSWKMFSQKGGVCSGFEIISASEKYVVENDILFTNPRWEV